MVDIKFSIAQPVGANIGKIPYFRLQTRNSDGEHTLINYVNRLFSIAKRVAAARVETLILV